MGFIYTSLMIIMVGLLVQEYKGKEHEDKTLEAAQVVHYRHVEQHQRQAVSGNLQGQGPQEASCAEVDNRNLWSLLQSNAQCQCLDPAAPAGTFPLGKRAQKEDIR